jgi:hypothetical protein
LRISSEKEREKGMCHGGIESERKVKRAEGKILLFLMEPKIASNCLMLSEKEQCRRQGQKKERQWKQLFHFRDLHNSRARITFYPTVSQRLCHMKAIAEGKKAIFKLIRQQISIVENSCLMLDKILTERRLNKLVMSIVVRDLGIAFRERERVLGNKQIKHNDYCLA